jgi:hypothetical protein
MIPAVVTTAIRVAIVAPLIRTVPPVVTSIAGIPIIATISVTGITIVATIPVAWISPSISVARVSPVTIAAPLSYIAIYAILILRVCGRGSS